MASGRGKVILLGEHAVVYGRPALAAALDRGVTAEATAAPSDRLRVPAWGLEVAPDAEGGEPLARAFAAILARYPRDRTPLALDARVDLPPGAGLGCSAALAVAIVGAVDSALGIDRDAGDRAALALASERVFHGNPSGVDTAVSAGGGVVLYRRGEPAEPLRCAATLHLVVAHCGQASSTRDMVERVARAHRAAPGRLERIFDAMGALVESGRSAVEGGDLPGLGRLMDLNQALLGSLGVSTEGLEELCEAARQAGALGAKLTGAGGGGCVVALARDAADAEVVRRAVAARGRETFVAAAGGGGG